MLKNGLRLFIVITISFYKSFENYLKIYYDVLKIIVFHTFFPRNYKFL